MATTRRVIREENPGIRSLQKVVLDLRDNLEPGGDLEDLKNRNPIVLVPGFSGWGRPLLGAVNYFGGFSDFASALADDGYIVIQVRLSPLSSNRERACEIFQQLTNININGTPPGTPPTLIDVNYGNLPLDPLIQPKLAPKTWQAVIYGADKLAPTWRWSTTDRVTFICHSQGGTTVRYLLYLLSGAAPPDLPQFPSNDERARAKAVITLGTPHKGTTVTNVVQSFLQGDPDRNAVVDFVTSCSYAARQDRVYDLGLDHWGFARSGQETYQIMRQRIGRAVVAWFEGQTNGLYDNSIAGATVLNTTTTLAAPPTYFFTMAFCATNPFPNRILTRQDIEEFIRLLPGGDIFNFLGFGFTATTLLELANWAGIAPTLQRTFSWMTDVANRHLGAMGYFSQIPRPGEQVPRPDMLPVIAPFAYGMGGVRGGEWAANDGIVNTVSMDGPPGPPGNVRGAEEFVSHFNPANLGAVQGWFWCFGENGTVDHADQLGVFTDATTNQEVEVMYKLLAELATRLL
ncbi:hypothetical protein C8A03DRAFT_48406 [Achaetomium macrosporum]|uniref:Lipase-like C-terminal domain-containing protein n=1 Tax=Achaetomium macrosporum TaxID=79813 RepID=A0AAN7C0K7_9PEZI|nr:hypothetical protein C8A03DRAFT_48406 [Achaetomium macrosporum]